MSGGFDYGGVVGDLQADTASLLVCGHDERIVKGLGGLDCAQLRAVECLCDCAVGGEGLDGIGERHASHGSLVFGADIDAFCDHLGRNKRPGAVVNGDNAWRVVGHGVETGANRVLPPRAARDDLPAHLELLIVTDIGGEHDVLLGDCEHDVGDVGDAGEGTQRPDKHGFAAEVNEDLRQRTTKPLSSSSGHYEGGDRVRHDLLF